MGLKLLTKDLVVDNVWVFRFLSVEPLKYTAGQYVQVELPHDNPDDEGTKRYFTNSAAPFEEIVQITTRITDSTFKQALSKLETGSTALQLLEKPEGDFVLEDTELPVVFIAGGIGVTPFYSILKQREHDNLPLNVTLIYSGRTEDLPFKAEFAKWANQSEELKVRYIIGERLTAEKIAGLAPELNNSLVYLSGPEPMVEALGEDLKQHGLPESRLKQDFFPNYNEHNF